MLEYSFVSGTGRLWAPIECALFVVISANFIVVFVKILPDFDIKFISLLKYTFYQMNSL